MEGGGRPLQNKIIAFIKANVLITALFLGGLIFLGIGLIQFFGTNKNEIEFQSGESVEGASTSAEPEQIVVDVSGEVKIPGVYNLKADSRIRDAISAAGGLNEEADQNFIAKKLNLAAHISDGTKIYIPRIGEETSSVLQGGVVKDTKTSLSGLTSINNASNSELEALPGIGAVTAEKIINGRAYSSVDELLTRKIIGKSTYNKIKDLVGL